MEIRQIPEELKIKAKNELNEISSRTQEDLEQIRKWIEKQPYLNCRMDDQWLINFLRCSKFSLERTKEKLDTFYSNKTLLPEYFHNRDPLLEEVQIILKAGIILPLPKTTDPAGPKIVLYRWNRCNSNEMHMDNLSKVFTMILDILLLEDDNLTIAGACGWIDCDSFPLSYLFQLTPATIKKSIMCVQNGYPMRIKEVNVINVPSTLENIINFVISVISRKLKSRVKIHNVEKTKNKLEGKVIPQTFMPKEYGGDNGSLQDITDYWKTKVESYRNWFLEDEQYCTIEELRSKPKTLANVFGIEGSFRKLSID